MVLKFRIPFKLEGQKENHKSNNTTHNYKKLSNAVGLRILVQISSSSSQQTSQESNYVIVKSSLRLSNQTPPPPPPKNLTLDSCFLKTCHLCNKGLSLDKEVYMYRGDQGFCSIECRDRQIYLDDIKELEASTKKIVSSYRMSLMASTDRTSASDTQIDPLNCTTLAFTVPATNVPLMAAPTTWNSSCLVVSLHHKLSSSVSLIPNINNGNDMTNCFCLDFNPPCQKLKGQCFHVQKGSLSISDYVDKVPSITDVIGVVGSAIRASYQALGRCTTADFHNRKQGRGTGKGFSSNSRLI
ncbi:hypothetical protein F8388_021483 [Cannabis sativa]|uniref:FLZ-type domain-containing protein n=1 Tax=Cannabis sativa TaxID=3483 RepID=A0A7J6FDW6_CANSA|nr:hypothetical protein F8388_021483 [Cannabis sativa]